MLCSSKLILNTIPVEKYADQFLCWLKTEYTQSDARLSSSKHDYTRQSTILATNLNLQDKFASLLYLLRWLKLPSAKFLASDLNKIENQRKSYIGINLIDFWTTALWHVASKLHKFIAGSEIFLQTVKVYMAEFFYLLDQISMLFSHENRKTNFLPTFLPASNFTPGWVQYRARLETGDSTGCDGVVTSIQERLVSWFLY